MTLLYLKALHIIFVVTWFAGLFYFPRLLIYFAEAGADAEPKRGILQAQYATMQRRLWWGITTPSAVITLIFGLSTWYHYGSTPTWLVYKLGFVALLYVYHVSLHVLFVQQQRGQVRRGGQWLRGWNEVATVFLVAIVFLVVLKDAVSMLWGLLGLAAFIALLLAGIRAYKAVRERG